MSDWLIALSDAKRSRRADQWAIETVGITSLMLMEAAATGLADYVDRYIPEGVVVVVCGGGNNGGDGYAAARILRAHGRAVRVLQAGDPERLSDDARAQLNLLVGESPIAFAAELLAGASVVVDALLGTGFKDKPRGEVAKAIKAITDCGLPVVAVDVPSGVDASTGEIDGVAVSAQMTVTFNSDKPGLRINPGRAHAGAVRVVDIGIPAGAPLAEATVGLIIDEPLIALLPRRGADSNKFTSGHLYVAAGSCGLTGAAVLASTGAMRAGAGYVTACVPASQQPVVASHLVEVMQLALADDDGHHCRKGAEQVLAAVTEREGAVLLGPGLGSSKGARAFARELAVSVKAPLVIDADGLNAFAGDLEALAARKRPTVLTPHEGELARLLDCSTEKVRERRLRQVRAAAKAANAIVILKGVDTLICSPDGLVAVSPGATAGLATAGTGDVLGGVVGALLARGADPFVAAAAAVRLHARAAGLAAESLGTEGMIASDVVAALPLAWACR
jgi:NAD(P)H-hydrate epimerase